MTTMEAMMSTEQPTAIANETVTREIPAQNREALDARLAKLAKRAAKLGCPISYTWGAEIVKRTKERHTLVVNGGGCGGCFRCNFTGYITIEHLYVEITVSTSRPGWAGWQFLGTLDHSSVPGSVLRRMVPGVACPEAALAVKPGWCDHCRKVRNRTETFVVQHESGDVRVVGRNCIRDFLGHNAPTDLVQWFSFLHTALAALDEEGEGSSGGGRGYIETAGGLAALATAFAVVRMDGAYRPRAMEHKSTADTVGILLFGGFGELERAVRAWFEEKGGVTLADVERAWAALSWLANADASSDFIHNLKIVAGAPYLVYKNLGLFCAVIPAYDRDLVKRSERANRPASARTSARASSSACS
jgi:hypothetical protein